MLLVLLICLAPLIAARHCDSILDLASSDTSSCSYVSGNIEYTDTMEAHIDLNAVTEVHNDVFFQLLHMTELVELNSLATVGGKLIVEDNPVLVSFSTPALTFVGRDFAIRRNSALMTVSLSNLRHIGGLGCDTCFGLTLRDNPKLKEAALPALTAVSTGAFRVCHNHALFVVPSSVTRLWSGRQCIASNGNLACPPMQACKNTL